MAVRANAGKKIIDSALSLIRERGYEATTVDELCAAAGVTKGAFFHHFKSKEELAVAAAQYWSAMTDEFFRNAPYHSKEDPLKRVLGYIAFRKAILQGEISQFTCLVGTMVQETYDTHPAIRDACQRSIFGHAEVLARDIELARKRHAPGATWTSRSLALHTQAVLQGAFILAKASGDPRVAADSIDHLYRYIELLFKHPPRSGANQ